MGGLVTWNLESTAIVKNECDLHHTLTGLLGHGNQKLVRQDEETIGR